MAEPLDSQDGLDQAEFKTKMLNQLQTTGVVGQVKSQLRAQLLTQLQKGQIVALGPPPGDRPGLKRHALNSMIADYMRTVHYNYSLSVFKEESGVESRPLLTEDELLDVLKLDRDSSFYQSFRKQKAHGGTDSCFLLSIVSAISEAAATKGKESFTQTLGGDRYQLEVRMKQLEDEYHAKVRAARVEPNVGLEERLAIYRREIEEQAAAEVQRQVERIRDMEVAAARLDEASKARRQLESERLELDRVHGERLAKLRQREEEMMDKLRRQQRDVENVAYEHRQRILREEERLRNYKTEVNQQQDSRQEQLKQLERSLELRERAVASREAAAEKRLAEAAETVAEAAVAARQEAEREYMELKGSLTQQRMQLEMDRSRILELRSEATAEIAAARAKEERLRALETARAEAEARAAAHAADAEVCRLQAEKLTLELSQTRDELSRRIAQSTDGADAMLMNAAGAMNMLNAEAAASRAIGSQVQSVMAQLDQAKEEVAAHAARAAAIAQERDGLAAALAAAAVDADALRAQLSRVEALMDEAVAARNESLAQLDDHGFRLLQADRELSELRAALNRAREDAAAAKLQLGSVRRPPSRGPGDGSPGRRSITLSPPRRPGTAMNASISGLSLGIALGGGPHGALHGGGGGGGWGGGHTTLVAPGSPPMSQQEFPITGVPPRDPTVERLERLRRQEDILASQEDNYRRRLAGMQDVRDRSASFISSMNAMVAPHQQLFSASSTASGAAPGGPYVTYVMHGSPRAGGQLGGQQQLGQPPLSAAHGDYLEAQQHQALLHYTQQQQLAQEQQQLMAQAMQGGMGQGWSGQGQGPPLQQQQQGGGIGQGLFGMGQGPRQQQGSFTGQMQQLQLQQHFPGMQHAPHMSAPMSPGSPGGSYTGGAGTMQQQYQPTGMGGPGMGQGGPAPGQGSQGGGQGQVSRGMASFSQGRDRGSGGGASAAGSLLGAGRQHAGLVDDLNDELTRAPNPSPMRVTEVGLPAQQQQQQSSSQRPGTGGLRSLVSQTSRVHFAESSLTPSASGEAPPAAREGSRSLSHQRSRGSISAGPSLRHVSAPPPPPAEEPAATPAAAAPAAQEARVEPAALSSSPPAPPVVLPPPGLVMTSNLGGAGSGGGGGSSGGGGAAAQAAAAAAEAAAPAPAAKPMIPGLVMVRDFTPRNSSAGVAEAGAGDAASAASRPPPPPETYAPPPAADVESMMAAKMRMLQEQRERAMAAQQQQQQARRTTSASSRTSGGSASARSSHDDGSSRTSTAAMAAAAAGLTGGNPAGSGAYGRQPSGGGVQKDDSSSKLIAEEEGDTVAPELSAISASMRRLNKRSSIELPVSRQSSVNRRDLGRGTSFSARSEAGGSEYSVEVPGMRGNSMRAPSMGQTLDDIPSSLEGYELPGYNEPDDDEVEGHDDDGRGYYGFATEFSAGSVF